MATNNLLFEGYSGTVEISFEDACLHGRVLFIDDLVSYEGETVKELQASFESAITRYVAHCKKIGKNPNKPYSGTFNVRIGAELHKAAAQAAQKQDVTLNEFVTTAIRHCVDKTLPAQVNHIHQHNVSVTFSGDQKDALKMVTTASQAPTWSTGNATIN